MTDIFCSHNLPRLSTSTAQKRVALYRPKPTDSTIDSIGNGVKRMIARLGHPVSQSSFDFLTTALSVTAVDQFVLRENTYDGFSRNLNLTIEVVDAIRWNSMSDQLSKCLNFLSGDVWNFHFIEGGVLAPTEKEIERLKSKLSLQNIEQVQLFSGGMDSLIGAIDQIHSGKVPLLVSRASTKDRQIQERLKNSFPTSQHFILNENSFSSNKRETSTRARSFLFLALAAIACDAIARRGGNTSKVKLIIPENGFIALNPPLTPRRIGAFSTRTTHPQYLEAVQSLLDASNIPANIENPYRFKTKGEMMYECSDQTTLKQLIASTVSCGKWKRKNKQCGKCVPCLIRRASFARSNIQDDTDYQFPDLTAVLPNKEINTDLASVIYAIVRGRERSIDRWAISSGHLPMDPRIRQGYFDVAQRGLAELENHLMQIGFAI